jgi:hypothetical protein
MMKGIGAHLLQKLEAGHGRHVPVGDHQPVLLLLELAQGLRAVLRLVDVVEADLLQQVADNAQHRLVVVNDENRGGKVKAHGKLPVF